MMTFTSLGRSGIWLPSPSPSAPPLGVSSAPPRLMPLSLPLLPVVAPWLSLPPLCVAPVLLPLPGVTWLPSGSSEQATTM